MPLRNSPFLAVKTTLTVHGILADMAYFGVAYDVLLLYCVERPMSSCLSVYCCFLEYLQYALCVCVVPAHGGFVVVCIVCVRCYFLVFTDAGNSLMYLARI